MAIASTQNPHSHLRSSRVAPCCLNARTPLGQPWRSHTCTPLPSLQKASTGWFWIKTTKRDRSVEHRHPKHLWLSFTESRTMENLLFSRCIVVDKWRRCALERSLVAEGILGTKRNRPLLPHSTHVPRPTDRNCSGCGKGHYRGSIQFLHLQTTSWKWRWPIWRVPHPLAKGKWSLLACLGGP